MKKCRAKTTKRGSHDMRSQPATLTPAPALQAARTPKVAARTAAPDGFSIGWESAAPGGTAVPVSFGRISVLAPGERRPAVRRKCACGGTPGPSGECEECRKKRLQRIRSRQRSIDRAIADRLRTANSENVSRREARGIEGLEHPPANARPLTFRAGNPLKNAGPGDSSVLYPRCQGQDLGVTACDPNSGTLKTPPVAEHCAGDCVAQHEKSHRDNADDATCCRGLKACVDKAGNDAGRQHACVDAYNRWSQESEAASECLAYTKEEECLTRLIALQCHDKSRLSKAKIAGGIIGGLAGFVGGFLLGGLGLGLAGLALGGILGWKAGGLISPDCCDSLKDELDEVTKTKRDYCSAARQKGPVPCVFNPDGTINANVNRAGLNYPRALPATTTSAEAMRPGAGGQANVAGVPLPVQGRGRGRVPPVVHEVLRTAGQPLDAPTRSFMGARFGYDFSRVRVFSDTRAAESAEAVNALAYTSGRNVVFGRGQYAPHTAEGRKLLAHELTHVMQQQNDADSSVPSVVGPAEAGEEAEARSAEALTPRGGGLYPDRASGGPAVLRRQAKESRQSPRQTGTANQSAPAKAGSCLQTVEGEEIESLLESGVVTVIDYGAKWCGPCQYLETDLTDICLKFRATPPPVKVRFYTVDVDDPRNDETQRKEAPGDIPQLSIYVGTSERHHSTGRPEPDILAQLIGEQIEYASHSGAARGALTGLKSGLGIGGGLGLAAGIGLALAGVLTGGLGLLAVFGLAAAGAAVGLGLGAGGGAIVGALTDQRKRAAGKRVGFNEAETLIRRRYGRHLAAAGGPLHNARIRPVTQAQLQIWFKCRHAKDAEGDLSDLVGWTDTGPAPPAAIPSAEDEPVCANGQQLEHATIANPVIYYARDRRDLTVLIHEGLHAYAHPNFVAQARNYVNEGATEYFTRQVAAEIGAPSESGYGENTEKVKNLVSVVGEEALQIAFFNGDFSAANRVLGPCGMERWAQLLQMLSISAAEEVLHSRNGDYCGQIVTFPIEPADDKRTR